MASRPTALCPGCDAPRQVRGDGRFRGHARSGQRCPSSLQAAPEYDGQSAGDYVAALLTVIPEQPRRVEKYGEARLLRDIDAGRVRTDRNGRVWRADVTSNAGCKKPARQPVEAAEASGWAARGGDGVWELTGDGRAALAAWDATHDTAVGAVTVR